MQHCLVLACAAPFHWPLLRTRVKDWLTEYSGNCPFNDAFAPPGYRGDIIPLQNITAFMETYELKNDVMVFGFQVKTFPDGIGEAFDTLVEKVPEGLNRSYYSISFFSDGKVVYVAAVEEKNSGEAEKHKYERYKIEKGKYYMVTVKDWRTKTDSIKDVFHKMMQHKNVDHAKPCIEWYKNDDEMECMVKLI